MRLLTAIHTTWSLLAPVVLPVIGTYLILKIPAVQKLKYVFFPMLKDEEVR